MISLDDVRLILQKGVEIRNEPFTLKSGKQSQVYADLRWPVLTHPGVVADGLASFIRANVGLQHIGAVGGCPLMGPILAALAAERIFKPAFAVRPAPKDHGTGKRIEGKLSGFEDDGRPVVLLDDVLTTGGTLGEAIIAINQQEIEVAAIIVLCNRGGITQIDGIPVQHLFTLHEILNGHPDYREGVT